MYSQKRGKALFNANLLKAIALCFMTIDHIGEFWYFMLPFPLDIIFRILGRIAAPLFLFVFVESLRHSKSRLKLTLRLCAASVLMKIGNRVFGSALIDGVNHEGFGVDGNIFMTFFFLSIAVTGIEALWRSRQEKRFFNLGVFALCGGIFIVSEILGTNLEYDFFIPLGCVMYFVGRNYQCLAFGIYSLAYLIKQIILFQISHDTIIDYFFSRDIQWFMLFALPFMLLYNGEEGRKHKAFYYLYYPIHQYILNAVGLYFILL